VLELLAAPTGADVISARGHGNEACDVIALGDPSCPRGHKCRDESLGLFNGRSGVYGLDLIIGVIGDHAQFVHPGKALAQFLGHQAGFTKC